ncbi:TPA: aldehyde dehydrogenase family protein [Klebsiella pneumoniae]|nr:aldehyde dehydrogenase family protein [Klebsiella pneumoniae]
MMAAHPTPIVSPIDGQIAGSRSILNDEQVQAAVHRASLAFKDWRKVPLEQRIQQIQDFVAILEQRRQALADLLMRLIGRPAQQSDELSRVLAVTEDMIVRARLELQDISMNSNAQAQRLVRREPKGLCLAISAWNYPVAMAGGMSVAALLAGNVVLLKHAHQTAPIADFMAQAWRDAGGHPDVFQAVHLDHAGTEQLLASGQVHAVQFIGSDQGGKSVYQAAAAGLVSTGLELGGKDPAYVRADANLASTIPALVAGSFDNAGQSCCSVERIYVHESVYEAFVAGFVSGMNKLTVGHPNSTPDIGPVVSTAAAQRLRKLIAQAQEEGATVITHPAQFDLASAYVTPAVLLNVAQDSSLIQDEAFGPLVCITAVADDQQALSLMNDSRYGLTASIWSQDIDQALTLSRDVEAGLCYVNRCDHADLNLPWGGVKASGLGRTYGAASFDEYTVLKAFHVNLQS